MMLEEKENVVLGKLIALVNGVISEGDIWILEDKIREILSALQQDKALDSMVVVLEELKKKYLINCMVCKTPCGKTSDYFLNELEPQQREKKIKLYRDLLKKYDSKTEYQDILKAISELSW